jgi:hypothetical protein
MNSLTPITNGDSESMDANVDGSKTAPAPAIEKPNMPVPPNDQTLAAFRARSKDRKPAPRIKVTNEKGGAKLTLDHPEPEIGQSLLMEALGTTDAYFCDGLLGQLANIAKAAKLAIWPPWGLGGRDLSTQGILKGAADSGIRISLDSYRPSFLKGVRKAVPNCRQAIDAYAPF